MLHVTTVDTRAKKKCGMQGTRFLGGKAHTLPQSQGAGVGIKAPARACSRRRNLRRAAGTWDARTAPLQYSLRHSWAQCPVVRVKDYIYYP